MWDARRSACSIARRQPPVTDAGRRPRALRADRSGRVRLAWPASRRRRSGERSSSIVRPGMFTTIQDRGRWGFQRWGVPVVGPMDAWSARLANRLVGNADAIGAARGDAVGPASSDSSVTGGSPSPAPRFDVEIGGRPWRSPFVASVPRDVLVRFGSRQDGTRAYVAFDGGLAVPPDARKRDRRTSVRALAASAGARFGPATACRWARPALADWTSGRSTATCRRTETGHGRHGRPRRPCRRDADDCDDGGRVGRCARRRSSCPRDSDRMGYRLPEARPRGLKAIAALCCRHPVALGAVQLPAGGDADPADGRSTDNRRLRADRAH